MSRRGIQSFQPDRLAQIIAGRRVTQAELAAMVGVSPGTVSKWCSGDQSPERSALDRLANVVNVDPEWFTRPIRSRLSMPLFRSNASAHKAARGKLEVRVHWAQEIAEFLQEFLEFPELGIPTREFVHPEEISIEEIESAAWECRQLWGLGNGPIEDLALAVEGAGAVLVREHTGIAKIEGLSAWSASIDRPIVFLSSDKANGYRSRFDLAHELGHLVLHRWIKDPSKPERHKELEAQAHAFAGALLLPAESFSAEIQLPVFLDDLLLLKRRWGVSVAAMVMRLAALDLLSAHEKTQVFKRISARWGRKSEPGDGDRAAEYPRLLRRSIDLLVSEGVMPRAAIPRRIGLSETDIESLTGLPEGYFRGRGDVVDLTSLRSKSRRDKRVDASGSSVVPFPGRRLG